MSQTNSGSTKKTGSKSSKSKSSKTSSSKANTTKKGSVKSSSSKTSSAKKSPSTRKKSSRKKKGNAGVKWIVSGMLLAAIILIGAIITLDQQAMKKGQVGFWETVTGVRPARTAKDVETLVESILAEYNLGPETIISKGSTTNAVRENEKLRHFVFKVPSQKVFKTLISEFEDRARQKGVRVHNRHVIKKPEKWIASFYLGTHSVRTLKLDLHCFLRGTPTPAPIPEKYLNEPEPTKPSSNRPKIALIFDDFGFDKDIAKRFLNELDVPIALAVIPYQQYSKETIQMVNKANQTPMLHLPMEPMNPTAMGTQTEIFLTTEMDDETLRSKTREMLSLSRGIKGVNNHTGSRFTTDTHRMKVVMAELKKADVFFVDSRTIADSVAEQVAREMKVPTASRKIFIDQGFAGGDVAKNMNRLIEEAKNNGSAIGIGHAIGSTLDIVKATLAHVENEGIDIVPVASLTR